MAMRDPDFFQSVVASDLIIADGMPLIWIAKFLGLPIRQRVSGSDLFQTLAEEQHETKIRVAFFGGKQGIAKRASEKLTGKSSSMIGTGYYDPGFVELEQMSQQTVIEHLNSSSPDFIVVALGAKKGQEWIVKNKERLTAPIISHLGAVINFVAGEVKRSPKWLQLVGLEWVWRIKQEPALYKRYLKDGLVLLHLLLTRVIPLALYDRWKKAQLNSDTVTKIFVDTDSGEIKFSGVFTGDYLPEMLSYFFEIRKNSGNQVTFDFLNVEYVDNAFLASLLFFQYQMSQQNFELEIVNMSKGIERIFRLNMLDIRFKIITKGSDL
jgi:N-acetylglucosaminyldiphosphoundecaprenol N-acetyl-beta-D-mannosaminyltransferase